MEKSEYYINTYSRIAILESEKHSIPASIKLAQAILESSFGESDLARLANNHFGIKCKKNWEGDTFYKQDDDPTASCFRKYNTIAESFVDHSYFLVNSGLYKDLIANKNSDYRVWANALEKNGYATREDYAELLIGIVEIYNLQRFDVITSKNSLSKIISRPPLGSTKD